MKEISHIGEKIKQRREFLKISQAEVADYVGVTKSSISRWESGEIRNMGIDKLRRLANILQVDTMQIVNNSEFDIFVKPTDYNTHSIPLLGTIAAGSPILATENIEEYFNIDSSIKADFALRIKGDSMIEANINNNDIVFIRKQEHFENGEICAVLIDDEATLKRVYRNGYQLVLQPANKDYQPIFVNEDKEVRILGKLAACLHEYEI